ncbi:GPW/gp25 family protein [Paraburkholderia sp. Tr-20389]|uniref:GPW/gp25 family protein n=1 Tax=Paraburkholderia sp. Tr-20389 TaxID=2703903 RepID=UPI001980C508|nr:GPW/gp25 family protein [Paraburkholderia sp. Tr-20389]MBN3753678.1 GPW/gp25 family protein [Paraburkholderia sp. Tr-20389]
MAQRADYAFPFHLDPGSGQAAQAPYTDHVDQMIRQILLTAPGERADLPEFGCGVRQMLFAPNSDALQASARLLVLQSLKRWLGDQITVQYVNVTNGPDGDDATMLIQIGYTLLETQSLQRTEVRVN